MPTMQLELKEGVHVLTLTNAEKDNAFDIDVIAEYSAALDTVESYQGNTALMITCEHEKTFCNGINLEWLSLQSKDEAKAFHQKIEGLFQRLSLLNAPTVVCINGNCYAGGAVMATTMDFRFMREERGRLCYPEINLKMAFPPLMTDIINLMPNKQALKHMSLLGTAYTGKECLRYDLVDGLFVQQELQQKTFEFAKKLAEKDRVTYSTIKRQMRADISRHQIG